MLDPFRPISRTAPGQAVTHDTKSLKVDVVALDWKWLFIYPDYGVATVNEMAAPVGQPIDFRITSSSVMNAFYVPALAGMIYAMPGMQTQLHAVINKPGDYKGFSANYSGDGFSTMRFQFRGLDDAGFQKWVSDVKASAGGKLGRTEYLDLEKPSEAVPVKKFASVDPQLFHLILNMCVEPGKMCMHEMAAIDAKGGLGLAGIDNVQSIAYDKYNRRGGVVASTKTYVASVCTKSAPMGMEVQFRTGDARQRGTPCRPWFAASRLLVSILRAATVQLLTGTNSEMFDNPDLLKAIFGRLTLDSLPLHEPIVVATFAGVALGGAVVLRRHHLLQAVGLSLARVVHQRRPQAHRRHVHHPRPRHAAARLRRRHHDARCSRRSPSTAREGYLPAHHFDQIFTAHGVIMIFFVAMPLVTGPDELRRAAADRRARRRLPVPQQLQLLDDGRRRACW